MGAGSGELRVRGAWFGDTRLGVGDTDSRS